MSSSSRATMQNLDATPTSFRSVVTTECISSMKPQEDQPQDDGESLVQAAKGMR
jgi:hypothetical protein